MSNRKFKQQNWIFKIMLKITFFDCTLNNSVNTLNAIFRAVNWFKEQGIVDFEFQIIKGDSPKGEDFETLCLSFGNYDILNEDFYEQEMSRYLEKDSDICLFCYSALGRNPINLSEPTNVYKMVCAQAVIDNGEPWFYIRHELIHAFHQVLVNSGVLGLIDDQDIKEQLAKAYFCADNETKQKIEIENLFDVKQNWSKLVNNTTITTVHSKLSQVIDILKHIFLLKKRELSRLELWKYAYNESFERGLDPDEFCCVLLAESNFNNDSKFVNEYGSTDWGVCQINDEWWIGKNCRSAKAGKFYFESVEWVINHPKECIDWMIGQWKSKRKDDWCTYSSGRYKLYYSVQEELKKSILK